MTQTSPLPARCDGSMICNCALCAAERASRCKLGERVIVQPWTARRRRRTDDVYRRHLLAMRAVRSLDVDDRMALLLYVLLGSETQDRELEDAA